MPLRTFFVVTLIVGIAACTTPQNSGASFNDLRGCWRSAEFGTLDWQPTLNDRWTGTLTRDSDWCSANDQNGLNGCAFVLEREDGTWRFADHRTDDVQTYRLVASGQRIATFAAEGHPLRPPPDFGLVVQWDGAHILVANRGTVTSVLFEGDRCEAE
jgi:hypothetical protein